MNASAVKPESPARLSATELRARWRQLADDPLVAAIPFKVELNEKGAIEVTPANTRHGLPGTFPVAPELCVEVVSPSNSMIEIHEKAATYLAAGAHEVWLVGEDGTIEMFGASGGSARARSASR